MHYLQINGNLVDWNGRSLILVGCEVVDEFMVHIFFEDCVIGFRGGETVINGILKTNSQDIVDSL